MAFWAPTTTQDVTNTHSTEFEKSIPKPIVAEPKTIQDLRDWAFRIYEYDADKLKKIMLSYDIQEFFPDSWWTYTGLIGKFHLDELAEEAFPKECPICGAPTEYNEKDNHMFGATWGWRCTADRYHFIKHQWAPLKGVMVNRPDPLDLLDKV
jgi:hypothetical protein